MRLLSLHALCRNGPKPGVQIELLPTGTDHLARATQAPESQPNRDPRLLLYRSLVQRGKKWSELLLLERAIMGRCSTISWSPATRR
jgi:hypothetical protein